MSDRPLLPPEIAVMNPLLLDDRGDELILLPLHDREYAPHVSSRVEAPPDWRVRLEPRWDLHYVVWEGPETGCAPLRVVFKVGWINTAHPRMTLVFAAQLGTRVELGACVDGRRVTVLGPQDGAGLRAEVSGPLPLGALTEVEVTVHPGSAAGKVALSWVAVGRGDPPTDPTYGVAWDPSWPGLVLPPADRPAVRFSSGLLMDAQDLPGVRQRIDTDWGRSVYEPLRRRVRESLATAPESKIGPYLPWSDARHIRAHERGRRTLTLEVIESAFVAVVEDDPALIDHALRTLMALLHCRRWCISAEHRAVGSTWDQRCFAEEMATSAAALAGDWLGYALTDAGRALLHQTIWDKGLAVVERDMMKFTYLHGINQGAWFGRARVLGGLLLEQAWPHATGYVDRAMQVLHKDVEDYLEPDGGVAEGAGYFLLTMHMVLPAFVAYARARGREVRDMLPEAVTRSDAYFAAMSATTPGRLILDGDNASDQPVGDAVAMLARLLPGSAFASACAVPRRDEVGNYLRQYAVEGPYALILGPEQPAPPRSAAPVFLRLPDTGHLASLRTRDGRSMRVHLSGAPARPSHSHRDKGAITLELDGQPTLIDRGVLRYEDARTELLKSSAMHNVLTPVLMHGIFPDQAPNDTPVIPQGEGDERRLSATIDLAPVWVGVMSRYHRRLVSDDIDTLLIADQGELHEEGVLAFHLHSPRPFALHGRIAELTGPGPSLRIDLPWAEHLSAQEDGVDHQGKPVFHLIAKTPRIRAFSLVTRLEA